AGVLVRLAREPRALAEVARAALEVCHFDPTSGHDYRRSPRSDEDCEAACYDCLLSYNNQRHHPALDRQVVRDALLQLARTTGEVGGGGKTRSAQVERLLGLCDSELERRFLRWLDEHQYRLPDE